ncbi:hypothetical protein SO802_002504 [Lithocarpus litseifolius]|uniref:Uncharacterized protein n=1 Tax=Lithocarpus litseifolius TaxID=425828 RepID=A0AAW2DXE9_9ROSI
MQGLWKLCFKAPLQLEKMHGPQIVNTEGKHRRFWDSFDSKNFFDLQCESLVDVDPMDVECLLLSKARLESNKGKGLVRNVYLFKGIHKKHGKKHSVVQEMYGFLKSMIDVIIESKSVISPAPFTSVAAIEVQTVMEMVLSLPGVQLSHRLHMFSSLFFMENQSVMSMFAENKQDKTLQWLWLEKQEVDFKISDELVHAAYLAGYASVIAYMEMYMNKVSMHTNVQIGSHEDNDIGQRLSRRDSCESSKGGYYDEMTYVISSLDESEMKEFRNNITASIYVILPS